MVGGKCGVVPIDVELGSDLPACCMCEVVTSAAFAMPDSYIARGLVQ